MSAPVEYTDVQIYNRVLTPAEIQEYVDCNTKRLFISFVMIFQSI